tara:strand:- start:3377 stop:3685 length:309 start_codon:yes stop_codon:yes gene_type:complete
MYSYIDKFSKQETLEEINFIIKLCGKKRFKKLLHLYLKTPNQCINKLWYNYQKITMDCYDATILLNRLQKHGCYRYCPNAIDKFLNRFIYTINHAKNINIIK